MFKTSHIFATNFNISITEYWGMVPWQSESHFDLIISDIQRKKERSK